MGKRMFYILKIILESDHKEITGKEILEALEQFDIHMDIKTVYTCIKHINEFFYGIINQDMILSRKKKGFYIDQEIYSDGELQFLIDQITYHEDLKNDDKIIIKNKLLSLSSKQQYRRLVHSKPIDKKQSFSLVLNLSTIMKAIENKLSISFQYINYEVKNNQLIEVSSTKGNKGIQYILSPYQIISTNNHYYLIGYNDKYKNQLSTYRIDRMRYITTLQLPFIEIREQFDMHEEVNKMMNMYSTNMRDTLVIECQQSVFREIVSRFNQEIKAEQLYDQNYKLTIEDVSISEGLIGWLFMLQDQIKVISPLSLKDEIIKRIDKMNKMYERI